MGFWAGLTAWVDECFCLGYRVYCPCMCHFCRNKRLRLRYRTPPGLSVLQTKLCMISLLPVPKKPDNMQTNPQTWSFPKPLMPCKVLGAENPEQPRTSASSPLPPAAYLQTRSPGVSSRMLDPSTPSGLGVWWFRGLGVWWFRVLGF